MKAHEAGLLLKLSRFDSLSGLNEIPTGSPMESDCCLFWEFHFGDKWQDTNLLITWRERLVSSNEKTSNSIAFD